MKKFSLRKFFQNTFEDHEGRPGKVGGSLPRRSGTRLTGTEVGGRTREAKWDPQRKPSGKMSIERRREIRELLDQAMSFEKSLPKKLGNLSNPKSVGELKTGLKSLKGSGDLRDQAKETLTGAGWKHILRSDLSGADFYGKGPFRVEVYFGRNKTQVQFRKTGNSWQSL